MGQVLYLLIGLLAGMILVLGALLFLNKRHSMTKPKVKSITKWLFVTTQISALIWVFASYGIAIYSVIVLEQVYTLSEIADPAITTILGVTALKVLGNIFEHNNGGVFGTSDSMEEF